MKKQSLLIGLAVFAGILAALWFIARITGWLNFYSVASESNAPALKPGQHFFMTNLRKPLRNDFVGYTHFYEQTNSNQIWLHRLIGMPHDTLEIKNGIAFINSKSADEALNLTHLYQVAGTDTKTLTALREADIESMYAGMDSIDFALPDDCALISSKMKKRICRSGAASNPDIQKVWGNQSWDEFNFGPIVIPAHRYFVLGDNRENAADSRYIGFIKEKDIVGVKL